jgi:hypothetical protein
MCAQTILETNSPAPLTAPRSPWRVASVKVLPDYRLDVCFLDGTQGIVDLAGLVTSNKAGVFAQLLAPDLFAKAYVEFGAVTWPGELDLAPDAMYRAIKKTGIWVVS